jgi:hypothetical protein
MDDHGLAFLEDDLGFDVAQCDCGWIGPPCPDCATAAEFYFDHLAEQVS